MSVIDKQFVLPVPGGYVASLPASTIEVIGITEDAARKQFAARAMELNFQRGRKQNGRPRSRGDRRKVGVELTVGARLVFNQLGEMTKLSRCALIEIALFNLYEQLKGEAEGAGE